MFKKDFGGVEQEHLDISYETLWKSIIRPPRDEYEIDQLGDNKFYHKGKTYIRKDYELINQRGHLIQVSFLEEDIETRESYLMPVVIYLHGNSSSRIEGFRNAPDLLKNGINVVIFDFAGCGLSEGEYISLGWFEKDDVKLIIDFVEKLPGVLGIGLWGRSMGAATTMFYAHSDPRSKAICMDRPFSDFKLLAKELCLRYITLPNFVLTATMSFVKDTVNAVLRRVRDIRESVSSKLSSYTNGVITKTKDVIHSATNLGKSVVNKCIDVTKSACSTAANAVKSVCSSIGSCVSRVVRCFF